MLTCISFAVGRSFVRMRTFSVRMLVVFSSNCYILFICKCFRFVCICVMFFRMQFSVFLCMQVESFSYACVFFFVTHVFLVSSTSYICFRYHVTFIFVFLFTCCFVCVLTVYLACRWVSCLLYSFILSYVIYFFRMHASYVFVCMLTCFSYAC